MNVLEEWLRLSPGFDKIEPVEFYRMVFPKGELDTEGSFTPGKYTGIVVSVTQEKKQNGRPKIKRYTITDDLQTVKICCDSDDFCLCSPISYAGKARTAENARFLYAVAVDLDKVRVQGKRAAGLINLWNGHIAVGRIPKPTVIVSSGTGLHLYYILDEPIALFHNTVEQLQAFKHRLTWLIWNEGIVDIRDDRDIQYESIFQGFRMPGAITKTGSRARAFQTGKKVTMEYLNQFVEPEFQVNVNQRKSSLTLTDVEKKFPEWYERRILKGEPRGVWHTSRKVYEWWKRRILKEARVGHRYYCLMILAVYARKCSMYDEKHNPEPVTREELEGDAFRIAEYLETLTNDENNHFTESDVLDALEAFEDKWVTYPRNSIEYKSGILIQKNKRNGRKQKTHLKIARSTLEIMNEESRKALQGRPSKAGVVTQWRREHPDGKKADCIRETGLSKPTVYKYWKGGEREEWQG